MVIRICTSLSYTKYNSGATGNVLPLRICERQQSFLSLTDMESGSERKAKGEGITKRMRVVSQKTTPPEGGVCIWFLSLSNQSPLSISFNPSTGRYKRTSMHSRTASESTGARIHAPGAQGIKFGQRGVVNTINLPCTVPFPGTAPG